MIKQRETFLDNIAKSLNRERLTKIEKPDWTVQPQRQLYKGLSKEALIERLETQCGNIHTDFRRVQRDDLQRSLLNIFTKENVQSLVMPKDKRTENLGLSGFFPKLKKENIEVREWGESGAEQMVKFAEQAHIGLAYSDITLAESGTVTLFHSENHGRILTVLPKIFICIIEKETIVPRLTDAVYRIQEYLKDAGKKPSCISFISGPSNSADIELNLIVGVHGPVRAYYIVVD